MLCSWKRQCMSHLKNETFPNPPRVKMRPLLGCQAVGNTRAFNQTFGQRPCPNYRAEPSTPTPYTHAKYSMPIKKHTRASNATFRLCPISPSTIGAEHNSEYSPTFWSNMAAGCGACTTMVVASFWSVFTRALWSIAAWVTLPSSSLSSQSVPDPHHPDPKERPTEHEWRRSLDSGTNINMSMRETFEEWNLLHGGGKITKSRVIGWYCRQKRVQLTLEVCISELLDPRTPLFALQGEAGDIPNYLTEFRSGGMRGPPGPPVRIRTPCRVTWSHRRVSLVTLGGDPKPHTLHTHAFVKTGTKCTQKPRPHRTRFKAESHLA